jgi:hypothetical protein
MEEARREDDDFGVRLSWPADALGEHSEPDRSAHPGDGGSDGDVEVTPQLLSGDEQLVRLSHALLAKTRAGLDEVLSELRDQRRTQSSALADARTSAIESTAAVRRLATTTVDISTELGGLVSAIRQASAQQAAMIDELRRTSADVRAGQAELSEEVGSLRTELANVVDELGAVRRRLPVNARGGASPDQRRTPVAEVEVESPPRSESAVKPAQRRRRSP